MLELIMAVWGIVVLITGKFKVGDRVVTGGEARLCGMILVAPIPLSFLMGMILGATAGNSDGVHMGALFMEVTLVVVCFFLAKSIGKHFAHGLGPDAADPGKSVQAIS